MTFGILDIVAIIVIGLSIWGLVKWSMWQRTQDIKKLERKNRKQQFATPEEE